MSSADLKPCYDFGDPNEEVRLASAPAKVEVGEDIHKTTAEISLRLLPKPRLTFQAAFDTMLPSLTEGMLCLDGTYKVQIPVFATRVTTSSGAGSDAGWVPTQTPVIALGKKTTEMTRLVFHLFNFKDILGTRRSNAAVGDGVLAIEHVDLAWGPWQVEIRSLTNTRDAIKNLKEQGGFGLTHVGSLERSDGALFKGGEAANGLVALRFFLSLARGLWCSPVMAVGFDQDGKRVWEQWDAPHDSWGSPSSWFDPHNCDQLVALMPGFMRKWQDESWRGPLQEVSWYAVQVESNGLILWGC